MGKRGRPKKIKEVEVKVKGKRGRPKKGFEVVKREVIQKIVDSDKPKLTPNDIANIVCPVATMTHSFCPDCGKELKDISIYDADMDENCETFGCPECNQEVTKDNEVTLTISRDGMRLDYNSLSLTKIDD